MRSLGYRSDGEVHWNHRRIALGDKFGYWNNEKEQPHDKNNRISVDMAVAAIAGRLCNTPREPRSAAVRAFTDTGDTTIGSAIAEATSNHPGQSGFLLLESGLDAFVARAVLARFAKRSIDVQYYLYHDDLVGRLFTDQLIKAADRGVRVRLLVDDMDLSGRDLGLAVLDAHPNIEVRILTPSAATSAAHPSSLPDLVR